MEQGSYKYWAFISYSHRDQAWAEWLHKALETYRVPRRLVGRETAFGPAPRRLLPVFRDQEELPSSPNLSGAIDQALLQSRYLIVIASPYAAVSKWVDQEIERFRALGRSERILCLIVDGEPHADLQPGKGLLECFPPSLRTEDGIEPIAADVRPGKDGKAAARLKLIAGLLNVGLDELRQRERRRRMTQNVSVMMISVLMMVVLAGLWQMQQREKREALAQQALHAHIDHVYESGRQELLEHNEARAAVYLNEAYRLGIDTPALHFMLAQAMRIVDAEKLAIDTGAPIAVVKFSPDSRWLITAGTDGLARVWDAAKGDKKFELSLPRRPRFFGPTFSRNNGQIYYRTMSDGASNGFLDIWDAQSGRPLCNIKTHPSLDHTFTPFDRDGRHVASVASDGAVEIYDVDSCKTVRRIAGDYSVAGFSRDGRYLLVGDHNGEVTLWDDTAVRKLKVLNGLNQRIVSIDDTEDGKLLAAAGQDGSVRAWQVADGELRLIAGHPSPSPQLVFNIDGTRLLTWASDGVRVWNPVAGSLVYAREFTSARNMRVDISPDGRWMMSANGSRLMMQDIQSGADLFTLDGHQSLPEARDIADDGRTLATGAADGHLVLWNIPRIPDEEFLHAVDLSRWTLAPRPPGVAAVFSHSGKLIATGAGDGMLKIWDAQTHQGIRSVHADSKSVNVIDFSPDDHRIATGGETGGVKIWDVDSQQILRTLDGEGRRVLTVAFSGDGRYIAAALRGGITWIWDADSGEKLSSFERDSAWAGRFSPDSRNFAVGIHGQVRLFDIARREFVWTTQIKGGAKGGDNSVAAVDFSADGKRVLATGFARNIFLLDALTGHILQSVEEASSSEIDTARFDHHDSGAVTSDSSGVAAVWRFDSGQVTTLRGHSGPIRASIFSPDDSFVLTSGADGTAKIWDASSGQQLDTVAAHPNESPDVPFQALSVSPDGRWVLTGSIDGVIHLWGLRKESRSPQQIAKILRCRAPWQLQGEGLLAVTPDFGACDAQ